MQTVLKLQKAMPVPPFFALNDVMHWLNYRLDRLQHQKLGKRLVYLQR